MLTKRRMHGLNAWYISFVNVVTHPLPPPGVQVFPRNNLDILESYINFS